MATPASSRKSTRAAIGAAHLLEMSSSAPCTSNGRGRMRVAIGKALMPGSNTPKPPGSQVQCWPGCQTRESSRRVILALRMVRATSHARASSTPAAKRECQPLLGCLKLRLECGNLLIRDRTAG